MYVTKQIQHKLQKRKVDIHQRSIFRQMMNTCDKFQNSFLTKQESRIFDQKQKLQTLQQKNDLLKPNFRHFRKTHLSLNSTQNSLSPNNVYVKESKQIKQIKILRQKMIPKLSKTNLQKKFKEIAFIRNMGYKTKNKKLESFKTLTIQQDQENIINKSWDQFYKDKKFLSSTLTSNAQNERSLSPIEEKDVQKVNRRNQKRKSTKKSSYFLSSNISAFKFKNSQQNSLNSSFSPLNSTFSPMNSTVNPNLSFEIQSNFNETSVSNSLGTSFVNRLEDLNFLEFEKKIKNDQRPTRISTRNKTLFKETIKSLSRTNSISKTEPNTKRYPLSSDRNKEITQKIGLSKQKLSKENAFSLYKLIKGGYESDKNDIEGDHISLKKFREAKDNFMMLNNCFKKIKEPRYLVQQPQKVFNDGSFRSLVYLTEIENKISPATFRRVQELNNVVD